VIFRREPIHKRLARQARLDLTSRPRDDPEPVDPGPYWGETGIHGVPRPRRWDGVGSADAPGIKGDEVHFVALETGDLIVEEHESHDRLAPLAETLEQAVDPPFRAEAVRREGDVWAVAARRVRVVELDAPGEELELAIGPDDRVLTVDGERSFGSIPALEQLGAEEGQSYVVRARRLRDRLWEVETSPL
jgi:hypothetical protein